MAADVNQDFDAWWTTNAGYYEGKITRDLAKKLFVSIHALVTRTHPDKARIDKMGRFAAWIGIGDDFSPVFMIKGWANGQKTPKIREFLDQELQ
jgi:hypothetical protein